MENSNNNNKQLDNLLKSKLNIFNEDFRNFASYERQKVAIDISNRKLHGQGLSAQLADKIEKNYVFRNSRVLLMKMALEKQVSQKLLPDIMKSTLTLCLLNVYQIFILILQRDGNVIIVV